MLPMQILYNSQARYFPRWWVRNEGIVSVRDSMASSTIWIERMSEFFKDYQNSTSPKDEWMCTEIFIFF